MSIGRIRNFRLVFVLILIGTAGCGGIAATEAVPATSSPVPTPAASRTPEASTQASLAITGGPPPTKESTPERALPVAGWVAIAPGIEARTMPITGRWPSEETPANVVRIDPALARVSIRYDPDHPQRVAGWADRLGGTALVVINAGYFQHTYVSAGLVVADGERHGTSFGATEGFAEGMFGVAGGKVSIRSLASQPYDPSEPLDQAVQGLPMLIEDGEMVEFELGDAVAPRTVIALDGAGRLLLIHVGARPVSLPNLRDWLRLRSGLGIVAALNLDGGRSAGMIIGEPYPVRDDSVQPVPSVLVVSVK